MNMQQPLNESRLTDPAPKEKKDGICRRHLKLLIQCAMLLFAIPVWLVYAMLALPGLLVVFIYRAYQHYPELKTKGVVDRMAGEDGSATFAVNLGIIWASSIASYILVFFFLHKNDAISNDDTEGYYRPGFSGLRVGAPEITLHAFFVSFWLVLLFNLYNRIRANLYGIDLFGDATEKGEAGAIEADGRFDRKLLRFFQVELRDFGNSNSWSMQLVSLLPAIVAYIIANWFLKPKYFMQCDYTPDCAARYGNNSFILSKEGRCCHLQTETTDPSVFVAVVVANIFATYGIIKYAATLTLWADPKGDDLVVLPKWYTILVARVEAVEAQLPFTVEAQLPLLQAGPDPLESILSAADPSAAVPAGGSTAQHASPQDSLRQSSTGCIDRTASTDNPVSREASSGSTASTAIIRMSINRSGGTEGADVQAGL
jgi:hypothetical protein